MSTASAKSPSRVVFIGNIPFDLSEEQLIDIFKEVGPITNFRLMFDKDTGKPRGFAFCEYSDPETAGSAIRNLNGFDVG
jgi:cleavage stimulation factor subunit 2